MGVIVSYHRMGVKIVVLGEPSEDQGLLDSSTLRETFVIAN